MGTTADKIESALDTKQGLKSVIEDNGKTAPTKFSDYPTVLDDIIDSIKGTLIVMDTIVINKDTTLAQLNTLFSYLPEANSYTASTKVLTVASGTNVRTSGATSGTAIGKVGQGDIIPILGTSSSGWYRINRYRYGTTTAAYNNPLRTYNNSSAYTSNTVTENTVSNKSYPLKQIDISAVPVATQRSCNFKIAEAKGWVVMVSTDFDAGSSGVITGTTSTTTYAFNNCYTDNYSSSSYSSKSSTNTSTIRQGYYSGYYYYKGNFRFTSSRLKEVKAILNNSTVSKVEVYVERANSTHGTSGSATLKLYACDSTGKNLDALVDGSSTFSRGSGKWITLSDTIVSGFKTGKYDHFKAYHPSTSLSYYIVFSLNAKMRITYTT